MFCGVVHAPVLSGTLRSTGGPNMQYVVCNHPDEALWTRSSTGQTWVCSSSPADFLCGIWKRVHSSCTSALPTLKKRELCSYLPRDWEAKLLLTGKCQIWGSVRYRDVISVSLSLIRACCMQVSCSYQRNTKADVWDMQLHFLMLLFTVPAFFFSLCKIMTF